MTRLQTLLITVVLVAVVCTAGLAMDKQISNDETFKATSDSARDMPELILSKDGETITNQAGEIVARRINAYEPVTPAVSTKRQCPQGQTWGCTKTERRYRQVCLELVGGMCLKYGVKSWLECVTYDCVGKIVENNPNVDPCKWCVCVSGTTPHPSCSGCCP